MNIYYYNFLINKYNTVYQFKKERKSLFKVTDQIKTRGKRKNKKNEKIDKLFIDCDAFSNLRKLKIYFITLFKSIFDNDLKKIDLRERMRNKRRPIQLFFISTYSQVRQGKQVCGHSIVCSMTFFIMLLFILNGLYYKTSIYK